MFAEFHLKSTEYTKPDVSSKLRYYSKYNLEKSRFVYFPDNLPP